MALFLALMVNGAEAATEEREPECRPKRWTEAIQKFKQADNAKPPKPGGVVFVGSSSIRLWDLEKCFPKKQFINRGFGGSEICDSVHYFDTLVARHQPKIVVLYAGDNDVAGGKKSGQVVRDFRAFDAKLKESLPASRLIYIAIKPSLSRWNLSDEMNRANQLIASLCNKEPKRLTFLDIWKPMLGPDGKPRKELFQDDGLHLDDKGYELWTSLLQEQLTPKKEK